MPIIKGDYFEEQYELNLDFFFVLLPSVRNCYTYYSTHQNPPHPPSHVLGKLRFDEEACGKVSGGSGSTRGNSVRAWFGRGP